MAHLFRSNLNKKLLPRPPAPPPPKPFLSGARNFIEADKGFRDYIHSCRISQIDTKSAVSERAK